MAKEVRENKNKTAAVQSSNIFIKGDKMALNWYKNETNKLLGFFAFPNSNLVLVPTRMRESKTAQNG